MKKWKTIKNNEKQWKNNDNKPEIAHELKMIPPNMEHTWHQAFDLYGQPNNPAHPRQCNDVERVRLLTLVSIQRIGRDMRGWWQMMHEATVNRVKNATK